MITRNQKLKSKKEAEDKIEQCRKNKTKSIRDKNEDNILIENNHCDKDITLDTNEFNCANSLNKLKCRKCSKFETDFLVDLREHVKRNCAKLSVKEIRFKCKICKFQTCSKYLLLRHSLYTKCSPPKRIIIKKPLKKKFNCDSCSYKCYSRGDLKKHTVRKHTDLADIEFVECYECGAKFKEKETLENHVKLHLDPLLQKWIKCDKCDYITVHRHALKSHILNKHPEATEVNWYHCEFCSYKAKFKFIITNHTKYLHSSENELEWLQCSHCSFKTKRKQNFQQHQLKLHSESVTDINYLLCEKCPFKTLHKYALAEHMIVKHSSNPRRFACKFCDYKAKFYQNLNEHIITRHTDDDKIKWFECSQCDYKSKLKYPLKKHLDSVHNNIKKYKCQICSLSFKSGNVRKHHVLQTHTDASDVPVFKCSHCPYETKLKPLLKSHLANIHFKVYSYSCEHCDFHTNQNNSYKNHLIAKHAIGENIKELKCDQCDYKSKFIQRLKRHVKTVHNFEFVQCKVCHTSVKSTSMRSHLKTHKPAKVYLCEFCPSKYKSDLALKYHVMGKHTKPEDIVWIYCKQCDFKTFKKDILYRHENEVHAERKFQCDLCDSKFKAKRLLQTHLDFTHNKLKQKKAKKGKK